MATTDWRMTVYGTDPTTGGCCILDLAEGPADAINDLIDLHGYRPGKIDHLFGTPITEVTIEAIERG
jgi:hypothetical protein